MLFFNQILIFALGASLASFAVLVGMRVPAKVSIISPRSYCDHCSRTLAVEDLIPLLSYFVNGRRSRCCRKPLSSLHFILEFAGGFLALIIYHLLIEDYNPQLALQLILTGFFGIIFTVSDLQTYTLPNSIMKIFLLLSFSGRLLFDPQHLGWIILGSLGLFSLLSALSIMKPGSLGGGDIKLILTFSILYGLIPTVKIIFLASGAGILFFILAVIIRRGRLLKKLPFGVFLFGAAGITLLVDSVFFTFF